MNNNNYGKELILDLHLCNTDKFNRKSLRNYFKQLCLIIDMQRAKLVFWDDYGVSEDEKQTLPHTTGTSAVQFILTSNITIHTLDILQRVYVNIFSCKEFDDEKARDFTELYFDGVIQQSKTIDRR
jgi:S-adenosylmethionine/arginine decarboxylase-like enzyme